MSFRATIPGRNADNGIRTRNLWNLTPARLPVAPYPHCRPAVTGRFYKGIKYGSYNPSVEGSRATGNRTRKCSSQSAVPYRFAIALFGAVWVSPALVCMKGEKSDQYSNCPMPWSGFEPALRDSGIIPAPLCHQRPGAQPACSSHAGHQKEKYEGVPFAPGHTRSSGSSGNRTRHLPTASEPAAPPLSL